MKQIKPLFNKALMFCVSVLIVVVLLTLLAQIISLTFYTICLVVSIGVLGYLFCRKTHESNSTTNT